MSSFIIRCGDQLPRLVAVSAGAVIVILAADPWWSMPAWVLALLGPGCRR